MLKNGQKRLKQFKIAQNRSEMDTMNKIRKNFGLIKIAPKCLKSPRECSKATDTAKQHKCLKTFKNVKNVPKLLKTAQKEIQ